MFQIENYGGVAAKSDTSMSITNKINSNTMFLLFNKC